MSSSELSDVDEDSLGKKSEDDSEEQGSESGEEKSSKKKKKPRFLNKKKKNEPRGEWKFLTEKQIKKYEEPHELTITQIGQTHDLIRTKHITAKNADEQSSEEWLKHHSVDDQKLTMKELIVRGKTGRPVIDQMTGKVRQHLTFDAKDINEFEYKLHMQIESYSKRIKWMLHGSKKMFGLLKGTKVAVVIDSSDANTGFGRLTNFQDALVHLIDEQLAQKQKMYIVTFGSDVQACWPNVRDVNHRTLEEAKDFVSRMTPSGGCNLLKAMKHIMKQKDINQILLVLGSVPDQSSEVLCDYVCQMGVGKFMPLHTVAYDCSNNLTNTTLKTLADDSDGRYHCYTSTSEEQIYTGSDISLLLKEIQKAQDIINKIKEMRKGMMGSALVSIENERLRQTLFSIDKAISMEVAQLPQSNFLPRPPGHANPLRLEMPKFLAKSSQEWLLENGLKAKQLDLYQVLSPNAYSYKEEFIPVIRRTVQSQVHEKAMTQFQWQDGTVRNVHVDMTQMFEYQKHLGSTVKLFEKRIEWLSTASRKIFGTVVEKNVVIIVDLSISNSNYLIHIQHSLRLLLEQQMANKEYFNIIGFGSIAQKWRPTMVKPTPENLQQCWNWVLDMQCGGSRNFMEALRLTVENEEEGKHHIEVEGVYLFTSGIPDQPSDICMQFVEESIAGRGIKLHTILFNVDDYDSSGAIPGRYANITSTAECLRNLAHCSGGRFHWFRETGIIESDDLKYISSEIDKAINFSQKCALLVESVKKKYNIKKFEIDNYYTEELTALPSTPKFKALPAPKQTRVSLARLQLSQSGSDESIPKALSWRPGSAGKKEMTPTPPTNRPKSAKDPMMKVKTSYRKEAFYTEEKNGVGTVYKKFPNMKSVRKEIRLAMIPEKEEIISTKEWMRLYSLSKLKLDLNKMVSGPDCKHVEDPVQSLHKYVPAKYCSIFPHVNIKGSIKHLQLLPHELMEYEEQVEKVLKRYIKRLQWLLSGSRRVFGSVIHKQVAVLIDTSGSMEPYMDELRKELASLVWDQLHRQGVRFNLIRFSKTTEKWQDSIVQSSEEMCHDAVRWVSKLVASGNTCTLDALDRAFEDPSIDAIYLLTDGKPDHSTSMVLREVAKMNFDRHVAVNTISFNCDDSTANNFLKLLAAETGGRFHRIHSNFDAHMFAHKLLTEGFSDTEYPHLPDFEGDDLHRLSTEIAQARRYLTQSRTWRVVLDKFESSQQKGLFRGQPKPHDKPQQGNGVMNGMQAHKPEAPNKPPLKTPRSARLIGNHQYDQYSRIQRPKSAAR